MSPLSLLSSAALRRRSVCMFLLLLVVCITVYTVDVKSSSAILKLFSLDGRTALKYLGTNDKLKEPQNEAAPPPAVQQNVKPKEPQNEAAPPPAVQQNVKLKEPQNEAAPPPAVQQNVKPKEPLNEAAPPPAVQQNVKPKEPQNEAAPPPGVQQNVKPKEPQNGAAPPPAVQQNVKPKEPQNGAAPPPAVQQNVKPKEPQNEAAPPPAVQQNVNPQQEERPTEPPPPIQGLQLEDGLLEVKSQNAGAGNLSNDGLLERGNQNLAKTCQPKSHVVFLKTHKTASSTVQNVLYRYGESRGLTFALPRNGEHVLNHPSYFHTNFVEKKGLTHFDILCNHIRFRKSEVKKLMPEDSFYFSILRHPVPTMESGFLFFKYIEAFRGFRTLDDFLDNGQNNTAVKHHLAHNSFAFDFGYDNTATADTSDLETVVNKVIAGIEQDFHLILITEYFDESMILLKHALCWSLEDVVSFKVNSRPSQSLKPVSSASGEKIKRWNVLDWRLYEHFNATFWHKVRSLVGEDEMKLQVSQLKELQAKLSSACLDGGHAVNEREVKDKRVQPHHNGLSVIQGYNLNPNLDIQTKVKCQRMIFPEVQYTSRLYGNQFKKRLQKS